MMPHKENRQIKIITTLRNEWVHPDEADADADADDDDHGGCGDVHGLGIASTLILIGCAHM